MKKTLVALAALAATGAFAQSAATLNAPGMATLPTASVGSSSFTIGGMIDADYNVQTANTGVVTNNVGSNTASRLRFVGVQDLGGGTKANFWLEMQPSIADGSTSTSVVNNKTATSVTSSVLFNRGAWAGLSGNWGEVRLGRQGTNAISTVTVLDAQQGGAFFGFSGGGFLFNGQGSTGQQGSGWFLANPTRGGYGQASSTTTGTYLPSSSAGGVGTSVDSTRYTRAIRYQTPTIAGGLVVGVSTAYGNSATASSGSGGGSQGIDAKYAAGPLIAGASYQKAQAEANDTGADTGSLLTMAANYNFGPVIVAGGYQTEKAAGSNVIFNSGKSLGLAAYVPVGAATPYIKLGTHSYDTLGTNTKIVNLGATYDLSKTTKLFAEYAKNNAPNNGQAASGTSIAAGTIAGATATASPKLFSVGTQINF